MGERVDVFAAAINGELQLKIVPKDVGLLARRIAIVDFNPQETGRDAIDDAATTRIRNDFRTTRPLISRTHEVAVLSFNNIGYGTIVEHGPDPPKADRSSRWWGFMAFITG